ncbi:hypothetical protein GCK72_023043 [Caenorhabditis remanei]|uniref:Uncharacterized protein n=1 Tax=Caenorhabditis remanei TaxID=31234 RepID=A0A6A5FVL8_CAERE|nr:hypothetical protein GCK72_023043 [Caenorhabditis remanei]KAF1746586.1 hypothetical protein GCK72_023043 [Caenorhabditis remanei]
MKYSLALMTVLPLLLMLFKGSIGREQTKSWLSTTKLVFDGTFDCPLKQTFCFTGFYVGYNRILADDDWIHLPFRCVEGYSRHLAQISFNETVGNVKKHYTPRLKVHHNCSDDGKTHYYFKNFVQVNAKRNLYFEEYRLHMLNQGSLGIFSDSDLRLKRDRQRLKKWFHSLPYHWNSTLDGYQPTENFKYLVKGIHVLPFGELEMKKFEPKSKEEKLKKLDEERIRLLKKISIEEAQNPGKNNSESEWSQVEDYNKTAEKEPSVEDVILAWRKRKQEEKKRTEPQFAKQLKCDMKVADKKTDKRENVAVEEKPSTIKLNKRSDQEERSGEDP